MAADATPPPTEAPLAPPGKVHEGMGFASKVKHSVSHGASALVCGKSLRAQTKKSLPHVASLSHGPLPASKPLGLSDPDREDSQPGRQLRSTGAINPKGHWSLSCWGARIQLPIVTAAGPRGVTVCRAAQQPVCSKPSWPAVLPSIPPLAAAGHSPQRTRTSPGLQCPACGAKHWILGGWAGTSAEVS